MIDKKIEADIKLVKSFLEFWTKFHSAYNDITSSQIISKDDEDKFLETKAMMKDKYSHLTNTLEFKYVPHGRLTDPVNDILLLHNVRFVSERNLKKLEDDWRDSCIFLNNILERLKNNKRRMEEFNPIGVFFKRAAENFRRGK